MFRVPYAVDILTRLDTFTVGLAGWNAHAQRGQAGAGEGRDTMRVRQRQNQRERAGPERVRQRFRHVGPDHKPLRGGRRGDMGDQGIEARPAFGREDGRDGPPRSRIGAQAIDRLGWKGDESVFTQQLDRP